MTEEPPVPASQAAASDEHGEDAAHFTTINPYWRESTKAATRPSSWRTTVRRLFPKVKSLLENVLRVKIVSLKALQDRSFNSFQTDAHILAYRNAKLSAVLASFLEGFELEVTDRQIAALIDEYDKVFFSWPYQNLEGGFGYNNGLFLFAFVRFVNPEVVIESGCWRGLTTYLLDAASSPHARLYCFDINLSLLKYRSPKAEYHQHDIENHALDIRQRRTVAFFDDHVSHLKRLRFSERHGIRFSVFDDDVSYLSLHSDGWPPLPTISMLFDEELELTQFEWVNSDRRLVADFDQLTKTEVVSDRYRRYTQDELFEITGYRNSSRTTYLMRRA